MDDNELTRRGLADTLAEHAGIEVAGSINHVEAREWTRRWENVDIVLLDAADPYASGDQFPGVRTVYEVRAHERNHVIVVVVTGQYLHSGLRRRMWEAGADYFYYREHLRQPDTLYEVVLHPRPEEAGVPPADDAEEDKALGVMERSYVNKAIDYIVDHGFAGMLEAPRGGRPQPRSRLWRHLREGVARAGRIKALNADGSVPRPLEDRSAPPSVTQLQHIYDRFARVRPPRE